MNESFWDTHGVEIEAWSICLGGFQGPLANAKPRKRTPESHYIGGFHGPLTLFIKTPLFFKKDRRKIEKQSFSTKSTSLIPKIALPTSNSDLDFQKKSNASISTP